MKSAHTTAIRCGRASDLHVVQRNLMVEEGSDNGSFAACERSGFIAIPAEGEPRNGTFSAAYAIQDENRMGDPPMTQEGVFSIVHQKFFELCFLDFDGDALGLCFGRSSF